jgi:hypothetical protein
VKLLNTDPHGECALETIKKKKVTFYLALIAVPVYLYIDSGSTTPAEFFKKLIPANDTSLGLYALGVFGFGAFVFSIFYFVMGYIAGKFCIWEQALRETSIELGLAFTNRITGKNIKDGNQLSQSDMKKIFHWKAIKFSLHISDLKIEGMYKGVFVSVSFEEGGEDSGDIMVLRANFPSSLSMGLSVTPIALAGRAVNILKKRITSAPDVMNYTISVTPSEVTESSEELQSAINSGTVRKLYKSFPRTFIDDERIISKREVLIHIDEPPVFKNLLTVVANAALAIHAGRFR